MTQLADNALTTLSSVKRELGVVTSSSDELFTRWINAASDYIEGSIGRPLGYGTITEHLKGTNSQYLILNNYPIVSVDSIEYEDSEVDSDSWELEVRDKNRGYVFNNYGWSTSTAIVGLVGEPGIGQRIYDVTYTYGYVLPNDATDELPRTLPWDIEEVVISMLQTRYNRAQKNAYGLSNIKQGRVSYTFSSSNVTRENERIIARYKEWSI